ncbi:MAG: type II toxin-antitoxin system HicB family antitoxin [Patescibacteria group bacterium]
MVEWMCMKKVSAQRKTVARPSFPVIVHADESGKGYWVECVDLEGCYSQGKTIDDALSNIKEAIALCLEDTPRRRRSIGNVSLHFVTA